MGPKLCPGHGTIPQMPRAPNTVAVALSISQVRHGVLSQHTVLWWEDNAEYEALWAALVEEHAPQGPTESHLVEEIASTMWRKRRLRLAEAASYQEGLKV